MRKIKSRKKPPKYTSFEDLDGRYWITAEGLLRYFGVHVIDMRRYFYRYETYERIYYGHRSH